ncbi:hypothetical protein FOZ60_016752 [Perkinsus olseni]|uniref:Uncharacterized protein n=1 Tax=Perkinsus olseni TaxID=32597 RepID=A0A7J6N3B3_PEROL|nr:hypothetical protein FOZ60_016752 [Perkinsus olseni]
MIAPSLLVTGGLGPSAAKAQGRSGRQLLRAARLLSRESEISPLRWLEVSDGTLDLVKRRTSIRLVEALEVGRLMALSNVADTSLKSALSEWVAENRDEDTVGTETALQEARLAMEVLGSDDPACTKACRRILWRAKDMNPGDLVVAWSLLSEASLSYREWSLLLLSTLSRVQPMTFIQAAQIATVLVETRSQEWQQQVDNADLVITLNSVLASHQASLCDSLPLPSLLRVLQTMAAVEAAPSEFRNQQRLLEQALLERIKGWPGDLPRRLDCGALVRLLGRYLEKSHLERIAQWAALNAKRRSIMTAEDLLVIRDKCMEVGLHDTSVIDEALRWWLCFKWKYDAAGKHAADDYGDRRRSSWMSLILSVRVQAQPPVCTRLFLKMFGEEMLQHPDYAEGQLITVLLETREAMTVVSQTTKRILEEIDRMTAEAVPLIEKELGDVKFLFVDPSTLRLCESSGEEVSSLDFDPFDERLTRKLGFSVVELGCCRALASPGFGARLQVAYFLLYGHPIEAGHIVPILRRAFEPPPGFSF